MATERIVFVSHASKDTALAALVRDFLRDATELRNDQIKCTSLEGHTISTGADWMDALRQQIQETVLVVFLITPAFLESDFCKVELGAVWISKPPEQRFPLLFPPVRAGDLSAVLPHWQGASVSGPTLEKLAKRVEKQLSSSSESHYEAIRDFLHGLEALGDRGVRGRQVAATSAREARLDIIWLDDGKIRHEIRRSSGAFEPGGDASFPHGRVTSVAAGSHTVDHRELFALGDDGALWKWSFVGLADEWSGRWEEIEQSPSFDVRCVAAVSPTSTMEYFELYGLSRTGALARQVWPGGGSGWSGWLPLSVETPPLISVAAHRADDYEVLLAAIDVDHVVWLVSQQNVGGPLTAQQLTGRPKGQPNAVALTGVGGGHFDLFVLNDDGELWHCWRRHAGERTTSWERFECDFAPVDVAAVSQGPGRQTLVALRPDGQLRKRRYGLFEDSDTPTWGSWHL